ncbi:MAG: thiamine-phosphate kinase [Actinomycetales bacterium]|nr:thiamine-phosphate kinase [Actinomycetales bacterium]
MLPTIADIGEHGVIERVAARIAAQWPHDPRVLVGVGDDAAVLASGAATVVCTDAVVEGVHFRDQWSSGADVGAKLAARNFADIAVMAATPTALLVSLTAPADTAVSWVEAFIDGVIAECVRAGAVLVGGDTSSGWGVVAAATAVGHLRSTDAVTRAGAQAGDVIAIAGSPGRAAAGLAALMEGRSDDVAIGLVTAHVRPQPDYAAAAAAAAAGATAMIDTSDGLLADLGHLAAASGLVVDIDPGRLPADADIAAAAALLDRDAATWRLTGGEDHLVLAAFPAGVALPAGFTPIGTASEPRGSGQHPHVLVCGRPWVGTLGYEHFR